MAVRQAPSDAAGNPTVPDDFLYEELGLVRLTERTASFPWATLVSLSPRAGCVNAPVRFDERDVETEHGPANEAPADERAGNG